MESYKMPYLPEEALRTQRVEIYLTDLKERLNELRLQHNEVIQNSVDIIQEIDKVSSTLILPEDNVEKPDSLTKIKLLIKEFENVKQQSTAKMTEPIGPKVDMQRILQNFEKLNESHVLKDSLVLFKRAKESFEKIDRFFVKIDENSTDADQRREIDALKGGTSLREKINMFNSKCDMKTEGTSSYASSSNSQVSVDKYYPSEEVRLSDHSLENGYDGDNDDSEYDLFAIKRKRGKYLPPAI